MEETSRSIVSSMNKLMQHESWHRIDEWVNHSVGLGHISIEAVNEEIQPIFNEDRTKAIIFAGKIFAYEEDKKYLIDRGHKFIYFDNDAEFILHLYEEYGVSKFRMLNGIFSFFIWDNLRKKAILVNDRYGMRPIYYMNDRNKKILLFSSELKAISKQRTFEKKIDWEAWNIFFRLGFLTGEDTFYKNIKVLPSGSVLYFYEDNLSIENYWSYNDISVAANQNLSTYIDDVTFLFKQSMKRRLLPEKKIALFLSGGLDSRGIAIELKNNKIPFETFTTSKFTSLDRDKNLASLIAQKMNVKNHFQELPDSFLDDIEWRKNYLLDYESDEHGWILPLLNQVPLDFKINYDGIAQDTICDSLLFRDENYIYLDMLESKKYEDFIYFWVYQKQFKFVKWSKNDNNNFNFFCPNIRKFFSDEIFFDNLEKHLIKYEGSPNQFIFFQLDNRTRREISLAPFQLIVNKLESFCPYLDNDYFEYIISLPRFTKRNQTLRSKLINELNPNFCGYNESNYISKYSDVYKKKLKFLVSIEKTLLKNSFFDLNNSNFLLRKFLSDYLLMKMGLLMESIEKDLYLKSSFNLIFPLYFFNKWLANEGFGKDDILIS